MRVWDVPCRQLCNKHLLGEHRELHAIWSILTNNKKGYANHPETKRWKGKLPALFRRHAEQIAEIHRRKFNHSSELTLKGIDKKELLDQKEFVNTVEEQKQILNLKPCNCIL